MPGTLTARFDLAALQPPDVGGLAGFTQTTAHPCWPALRAWCLAGSGPARRPFAWPWPAATITTRLALAFLQDEAAGTALAQALCLERDGSLAMAACAGAAGRLALRLRTKLHDSMRWRPLHENDAWDAGYVIPTPAGLLALKRFRPRRATLVVAEGLVTPVLRVVMDGFQAQQAIWTCPVRLLVLGTTSSATSASVTVFAGAG